MDGRQIFPGVNHSGLSRLAVLAVLAAATCAPVGAAEPKVASDGFTSARVCGECHTDIYNLWKNSLHAFSLSDPIFDTAFMQAIKEGGPEAKQTCLRCHAPLTQINGDFELEEGVTREGVSCDFCHTVKAVHLEAGAKTYTLEPGLVKRSVLEKAASPAHEVAYSELHKKSEFCGGCHRYIAPSGATIMGTYDEWLAGPYAQEGTQCQDCHMVLGEGHVVQAGIKETRNQIHRHSLIHDSDQIRSALVVRIVRIARNARGLELYVEVENAGSGHMVPTGIPTREVVLKVSVEADGRTQSENRRFKKVVTDDKGRILDTDYEALLRGVKVLSDNRIGPREKRLERFTFRAGPRSSVKVKAELSYAYAPMVVKRQPLEIRLSETERVFY